MDLFLLRWFVGGFLVKLLICGIQAGKENCVGVLSTFFVRDEIHFVSYD